MAIVSLGWESRAEEDDGRGPVFLGGSSRRRQGRSPCGHAASPTLMTGKSMSVCATELT